MVCLVDNCTFPVSTRGRCKHHYNQYFNSSDFIKKKTSKELLLDLISEPSIACIEWPMYRDKKGYGWCRINRMNKFSHVAALEIYSGESSDGRFALHSCDNPPCLNPLHLRWGSHAENMEDMKSRNRQFKPKGERNGSCKLTKDQALEIKLYLNTSNAELARKFNVSRTQIHKIKTGKKWNTT